VSRADPYESVQRDLAAEIGISYRMVAYYEGETKYPPAHLLPQLAKALGVSTDQLLGVEKVKGNGRRQDTRLWRRFNQVEKLPPAERRPIVQLLDAFLRRKKAENR
jgi:transcriptional regulator with XRE-family HTH domain